MSRAFFILTTIILLSITISASCEEGQIDINSASAEELDEITYIGPVKAQAIIDSRLFDSVGDLIRVYGIGEITLQRIKSQGLACVEEETNEETEEDIEEQEEEMGDKTSEEKEFVEELPKIKEEPKKIELETINLNPQIIKSEDDIENLNKNNYTIYGFVFFCILLGGLFFLKNKKYKNEFR